MDESICGGFITVIRSCALTESDDVLKCSRRFSGSSDGGQCGFCSLRLVSMGLAILENAVSSWTIETRHVSST